MRTRHGSSTSERGRDARLQQLIVSYQDSVRQAAREADDAASGLIKALEREAILAQASQAASRSLALANALFREGYSDFQRVLDAQRSLFAQQDAYLVNRSTAVGDLIALYKALGGGWQTGQPLVDAQTRQQMEQRTDWGGLLEETVNVPAANGHPCMEANPMNEDAAPALSSPPPPQQASAPPADPASRGVKWVVVLIVLSLAWYLFADRYTPYTQQARVQAFVVPVASEVSGRVTRVLVHNNQDVQAGAVLFEVDPQHYRIAADRARADLESMRRQIGASTAGIASAQAALRAAQANELKARQDSERLQRLYSEDPGTVSLRRLEVARATHTQAISQVDGARAEVERAREQQGGSEDDNAKLRSAAAALEKAELDLANVQVRARTAGLITDLRTEAGLYAAAGSPVMTLIAIHDVWISADMTENNLGHVEPGTPVGIVLDIFPGKVLAGRCAASAMA